MLQSLSIRNVVLIDKLDLEFAPGLSILTGETGAGKSILLDSLGLITGNRAETGLIRQGEDKLTVTAVFAKPEPSHPLYQLAEAYELELEDEIVIKRSLSRDGKSKIYINDQPVSLKLLKEFGAALVEIHGQFDNQGLLNPANHREILDEYGNYPQLLQQTAELYAAWQNKQNERMRFEAELQKAKTEEDNLRHWADELQKLAPEVGEEAELSRRRSELMNAEKILENLSNAYNAMTQSGNVVAAMQHAETAIDRANRVVSGKFDGIVDMLEQALVNAEEAIRQIEEAQADVNLSQSDIDNIEQRLFALRAAARKHQVTVEDLPRTLANMQEQLQKIAIGENGLDELIAAEQDLRRRYLESAHLLAEQRRQAAARLDRAVMAELPPLKMEKARFVTEISELPESQWSAKGINQVCFSVATNPNSPFGPLNKIASGGELARFTLALKVNLAASVPDVTMIFDEVDAGVGGATAQAVGERLARLASNGQVLIVTHSPQVAACGNHHFKVEKKTVDNVTTTYVKALDEASRFEEIARMLAGETITDEARAAARVLLHK